MNAIKKDLIKSFEEAVKVHTLYQSLELTKFINRHLNAPRVYLDTTTQAAFDLWCKAHDRVNLGHIRVTQYEGHNGGFSTKKIERYRVELVGVNGKISPLGSSAWGETREAAERLATEYEELLGWPIRRFKEETKCTTFLKELE